MFLPIRYDWTIPKSSLLLDYPLLLRLLARAIGYRRYELGSTGLSSLAGLWIHKYGAMEDLEAGAAMQMMDLPALGR